MNGSIGNVQMNDSTGNAQKMRVSKMISLRVDKSATSSTGKLANFYDIRLTRLKELPIKIQKRVNEAIYFQYSLASRIVMRHFDQGASRIFQSNHPFGQIPFVILNMQSTQFSSNELLMKSCKYKAVSMIQWSSILSLKFSLLDTSHHHDAKKKV